MPVERLTPERRREMTRNALIEAAAEVFARRGFHAASLEEIAETAGFTRGAIYSNFASKEDMLLAVVQRYDRMLVEAFAASQELEPDPEARRSGSSAAAVWGDMVRRDPSLVPLALEFRLYALRNPEFRRRVADVSRQHNGAIARLIEREAQAFGVKLKVPAEDIAVIMNAAASGLSELASVDAENAERYDRLAQLFFQLMAEAIVDAEGADTPKRAQPQRRGRPTREA